MKGCLFSLLYLTLRVSCFLSSFGSKIKYYNMTDAKVLEVPSQEWP